MARPTRLHTKVFAKKLNNGRYELWFRRNKNESIVKWKLNTFKNMRELEVFAKRG